MRLSHKKWCYRICPCVNVFSHFSFRCNCSCWPLLWSCSWRNPLRPRSWCNKCSVSPHRWDIRTGAYQSTRFSGKMTLHMNEWCIYIELYCVLFYTQSASQSCGGSLLDHHQCAASSWMMRRLAQDNGTSALTTHQLQVERRERDRANQVYGDY